MSLCDVTKSPDNLYPLPAPSDRKGALALLHHFYQEAVNNSLHIVPLQNMKCEKLLRQSLE